MKKTMIVLAAVAALFTLPSCKKVKGEGPIETETRAITNFSGVSASIAGKINYRIEPVFKVELIAQRNILDVIETSVVNGHLLVKIKNGVYVKVNEDIVVNISAPTADYLRLSGSGDMFVTGPVNATSLDLDISGSGSMTVSNVIVGNKIDAKISGSGSITLQSGTAVNEELKISGSGKLFTDGVAAEKVTATISGSGDMLLKASQTLNATISGSGDIYYRGTPLISTHISGSGKVKPL